MSNENTITIKMSEDNDIYEMTVNNEVYKPHSLQHVEIIKHILSGVGFVPRVRTKPSMTK